MMPDIEQDDKQGKKSAAAAEYDRLMAAPAGDAAAEYDRLMEQHPPGDTDPGLQSHDRFKRGRLSPEGIARTNAREQEAAIGPMGAVAHGIRYLAGSAPFGIGERVLAAGKQWDEGGTLDDARRKVQAERAAFAAEHNLAAPALGLAANVAAFRGIPGRLGKLGANASGGIVGGTTAAAERATSRDNPNESWMDKAIGTAGAGAAGTVVGAALPWLASSTAGRTLLGGGLGAVGGYAAAPEGNEVSGTVGGGLAGAGAGFFSPQLAAMFGKIPGKFGSAMDALAQASGTRGRVNTEFEGRDRLARFMGSRAGAEPMGEDLIRQQVAAGRKISGPLYDVAKGEGQARDAVHEAVAAAPSRMAALVAKLKAAAGQRALPGPGQSQVALSDAQAKLADLEDTIQRYARAGKTDDPMVAQLERARDEIRQGLDAMRGQSGEVARRANPASEPPWYSSRPIPARNEGRVGPMNQGDTQEAARASGWETDQQQRGREALDRRMAEGGLPSQRPNIQQGDLPRDPRQIRLDAGNDLNVRNPEYTPAGPQQGPQPNPMARMQNEQRLAQVALDDPHVQMQMQGLMGRSSGDAALKNATPDSYDMLSRLYQQMNAEFGKTPQQARSGEYWNALNTAREKVKAALVAKAPTRALADRAFQLNVGAPEESVLRGYRVNATPGAEGLLHDTPGAIQQWASGTPDAALKAVRQEFTQKGMLAHLADKFAGTPLNQGRAGILESIKALEPSGAANQQLRATFGDRYPAFMDALGAVEQETAAGGKNARLYLPGLKGHVATSVVNSQRVPTMETGLGMQMQRDLQRDPLAYQSILKQFDRGKGMLDALQNFLAAQGGAASGTTIGRNTP